MSADLHIHTIYSDGSYSPQEIINRAVNIGLNTIAISDHDTLKGIKPALEYAENKKIEIIPAIEFSTFKGDAEIHILGYFINYEDPLLIKKAEEIFDARLIRAKKMVELLNQRNIKIKFEELRRIAGNDYIGRPHIAQLMVKKGYIEQMKDAFSDQYIGNGGEAYVKKYKISPKEAIKLILKSGGLPVLAHPVFINHGNPMRKAGINRLKEAGLLGLEVYHSKHSKDDVKFYKNIAEKLNLLITGGSDFHGENSPGVKLGDVILKDYYVEKLRKVK